MGRDAGEERGWGREGEKEGFTRGEGVGLRGEGGQRKEDLVDKKSSVKRKSGENRLVFSLRL